MGWFGHPEPQGGGSAPAQRPVARGANGEIERRYGELINSRAFLYAFVDLEGTFLLMNRGMRLFLGPAIPDVLLSCCAPEHRETLQNLLRDARTEAVEAVVPLSGRAGTLWMDAEFSPAGLRGTAAVQIVGMDVTDWVKEQQRLASEARPRAEVREVREEPREAEPKVMGSERMGILDAVAARSAVVSDRGVCLAANASFVLTFNGAENEVKAAGKPAQRVVGRRLLDLFPEDGPVNAAFHRQFPQMLIALEGSAECCLSSPEGEVLWLEVRARPVEWAGLPAVMLTCADVSALRRTREQLERVTSEDCATGLLSRQGMERLLSRKVECAFRDRTPLSLIMLDVDGLRKINEVEGYAAADHALKALAAALKDILSGELAGTPPEVVGRWGGDEFMVLTFRSGPAARALANILRDRVHGGAFDLENAMTLSVGVAELRGDMDVSAFVGAAFDAMTAARRSGGNRTVLAEERGTVPGLERDFNRRDGTS